MRSCGISRTTSTISSMTGYTPSISNQTTSLRSTFEENSVDIPFIHAGNLYSTNAVQSAFPRSVHVAEVISLHLFHIVFTCVSSSGRGDYHSCLQSLRPHRKFLPDVLSSSVFHHSRTKRDILITSAIVKTILAGVVSTSDVKTLRIDLDPTSQLQTLQTTQSQCSTCWSRPHLGNSLPHLRLRQLSFFSSAAIRHDVFHHLPFDSSSPRESSGSRSPATPPVSCLARHHDG